MRFQHKIYEISSVSPEKNLQNPRVNPIFGVRTQPLPPRASPLRASSLKPRGFFFNWVSPLLICVANFYAGDSLNVVEVFDPIANRWEKCQPMTTARSRVGVAVLNGLLYAIGGYDGQLRLSTVEVYNPETDSWSKVESMNSKRRYVRLARWGKGTCLWRGRKKRGCRRAGGISGVNQQMGWG